MFKYGKKAGYLGVATIVLALVPAVLALILLPGMPDSLPMKFAASGEVTRWGSKFELLIPVSLALAFGFGIYLQARKKGIEHGGEESTMARSTVERFLRSGVITTAVINIANVYLLYMCLTGTNPLVF